MTYGTGADAGKIFHTATGTGPDTWNHDQSASGIADLVGNGSEWHGAIRRMGQELQILANNNGADSANAQTASSTAWKAIDATTGEFITPDGSGTTENSVKMTWANSKLTYSTTPGSASTTSREPTFANIVCDESIGDEAKLILQSLGMLQYGSDPELFKDYQVYFATNDGERLFLSGCTFGLPTRGLASFYSSNYNSRSCVYTTLGFRSAFVRLPSA